MAAEAKLEETAYKPNKDGVYEADLSKLPPNTEVLQSKAIQMLFTMIRDKNTTNEDYVFYSDRLCRILAEEGLARLCTEDVIIETPCGKWKGPKPPKGKGICAVSIVRSGDILMEAVRTICRGLNTLTINQQRVRKSVEYL